MTTARKDLVDVSVTRWYHCISKCVRSAFLMADEAGNDRKQWIENRLQKLAANFSVAVGGFAVMDNHLHVLCRLDPESAKTWSADEVIRRWIAVYPPANLALDDPAIVDMWVQHQAKDEQRVAVLRERLADLGWFMKSLKEPLSRMCNRADGVKGTFWEARNGKQGATQTPIAENSGNRYTLPKVNGRTVLESRWQGKLEAIT